MTSLAIRFMVPTYTLAPQPGPLSTEPAATTGRSRLLPSRLPQLTNAVIWGTTNFQPSICPWRFVLMPALDSSWAV